MHTYWKNGVSLVLGIALGWSAGTGLLDFGPIADANTPPVDAGSSWGQHTPDKDAPRHAGTGQGVLRKNTATDFNPDIESPSVHPAAYLDPLSSVIGNVEIGERVYVAPFASVRGDEGQPIHVGEESNIQDGVVIHGLETVSHGKRVAQNLYNVGGRDYAVFVGDRVSLAHQSHVHGPAWLEDDVFLGMQALVFKAHIGSGTVVEPGAKVIGVHVPPGRYVPAGSVVTSQAQADDLPRITFSYGLSGINDAVVHVNTSLADGYSGNSPASRKR